MNGCWIIFPLFILFIDLKVLMQSKVEIQRQVQENIGLHNETNSTLITNQKAGLKKL